jgi:Tfp pilus assembly protein FimT
MTLLEVLVVVSMIGIMGAIAVPRLNRSALNLSSAADNFIGNLRMARASAVSRGARYRVTLDADSYSIQRLQDNNEDGVWEPDGAWPSQDVDLPVGVSLTVASGDGVIEFDTRGLVAPPNAEDPPEIEEISLSRDGDTQQVEVWPSGQVLEV